MTGLRIVAAALLIALPGPGYQPPALTPEEEKESYLIYSTLLEDQDPRVEEWAIVQHTKSVDLCLHRAKERQSIYGPLFEDCALKNKIGFVLGPYFRLPAYTMVAPEEWTRSSRSRSFAAFSAVGFNKDRTRAAVCLWTGTGGKCHVLVKKDDIWQIDKNWRGDGCGWAA